MTDAEKVKDLILAKQNQYPVLKIYKTVNMTGSGGGIRFFWIATDRGLNSGADIDKSARKLLVTTLEEYFTTIEGNESVEDLRERIKEVTGKQGFTYEHGGGGGVGEALDRNAGSKEAASKDIQGLKVQANILRSLKDAIKDVGKYTDYAERNIVSWLDEKFDLSSKMIKETTVQGIEDVWEGQATVSVRSRTPGGTAANSPDLDNYIEERFLEFVQSDEFEKAIFDEVLSKTGSLKKAQEYFAASKTYEDRYLDIALKNIGDLILTKAGRPDMRYKKNKEAIKRLQKRSQNTVTTPLKSGKRTKSKTRKASGASTAGGGMKSATAATLGNAQRNALSLKELINAQLPSELLNRMHLPRLRNRTGRFRNSAEVVNVTQGPRGGTQIDYTYMRNPYETFEPGGAQGSTYRDPRALIGAAVRDIAMDITGKKFIKTRRV